MKNESWRRQAPNPDHVLECGHEVLDLQQPHYCDYISLATVKGLQEPYAEDPAKAGPRANRPVSLDPDHERFFIGIHQVYEIVFQRHIADLRAAIRELRAKGFSEAVHRIKRLIAYTRLYRELAALLNKPHFRGEEDFIPFRVFLERASGLESAAHREIELLSGLDADSPYGVIWGDRLLTFREALDQAPLEEEGRPKTRLWTEHLEQVNGEINLRGAFEEFSSASGSDLSEINAIRRLLVEYELEFRLWRKAHYKLVAYHVPKGPGTATPKPLQYLQTVIKTARFFPNFAQEGNEKSPGQE